MTGYARKFNENATMSFIVKDKQLLKKYTKRCETIEEVMKINFESKPVYGKDVKYIKTKIKMYAGSIITNFYNKKIPKVTLTVILTMKQNLILIKKNSLLKYFNINNKSLIVC